MPRSQAIKFQVYHNKHAIPSWSAGYRYYRTNEPRPLIHHWIFPIPRMQKFDALLLSSRSTAFIVPAFFPPPHCPEIVRVPIIDAKIPAATRIAIGKLNIRPFSFLSLLSSSRINETLRINYFLAKLLDCGYVFPVANREN